MFTRSLSTIIRQKVNTDFFDGYYRSAKIDKVFEIVDGLQSGEKVIIFSHFLIMLKCLSHDLAKSNIKHLVR